MSEKTITELESEIAALRQQVKYLRDAQKPQCPICGGSSGNLSKYGYYYCAQQFGLCGYLRIAHRGTKEPMPGYHRSAWIADTGQFRFFDVDWPPAFDAFFIAGRQVTKEFYLQKIKGE